MISKNDFISYFKTGIKNDNECGIGIEHEKFIDRKSTRLNSSHSQQSRMPSSA